MQYNTEEAAGSYCTQTSPDTFPLLEWFSSWPKLLHNRRPKETSIPSVWRGINCANLCQLNSIHLAVPHDFLSSTLINTVVVEKISLFTFSFGPYHNHSCFNNQLLYPVSPRVHFCTELFLKTFYCRKASR